MQFSMEPAQAQLTQTIRELAVCNRMSERYGLTLSPGQMRSLAERRSEALRNTGRMEFGGGILKTLIYTFCDSPDLSQEDYEATLSELQDLFYWFKNETGDHLSDDELLHAMRVVFDRAHGALERLVDTPPETLYRIARGDGLQENTDENSDEDEGDDDE